MTQTTINIDPGQLVGYAAIAISVISVFFEISKIKINPITSLLGWMGQRMNSNLISAVEAQGKKIGSLEEKIDKNEIDRIRWEILDFANSCRNGRRHTKDQFEHIINQNQKYHEILDEHGLENGLIDLEYGYIETLYKRCQEQNDFL